MSEKAKTEALLTIVRTLQLNLKHGIAITEDDIAAMEQVGREALAASEQTDLERLREWLERKRKEAKLWSAIRQESNLDLVMAGIDEHIANTYRIVLDHIADQFGVGKMDEAEIKRRAKLHYERLCEERGPVWQHMPSTGLITDGGCESFDSWFYINDGPELRAILEGEDAE